ncbi:hypothetical protein ILUMI_03651 [Ignelater luminosus]|uniref:Uncharacterized protein n=1 Tax=Ignelater luminosus TaxID=2038154 RepID=A0A8K0GJR2_IGNLU|nr:hypothetical protein ILUMI_03651 [Ignelater luminosus]
MERFMLGISIRERKTNDWIKERTKVTDIANSVYLEMEMGRPRDQNGKEYVEQTNTKMAAVARKEKSATSEDEVERRHSESCGRGMDEKSGRTTGVEEYEEDLYAAVGIYNGSPANRVRAPYKIRGLQTETQIQATNSRTPLQPVANVLIIAVRQEDPAGPMTFTLAIQPIIDELKSELNVFYLGDGSLSDDPEVVLSGFMNLIDRRQALQHPESGAWLQAIPSSYIGTLMDCVALRIGNPAWTSKGSGRFLRHSELNNILKRCREAKIDEADTKGLDDITLEELTESLREAKSRKNNRTRQQKHRIGEIRRHPTSPEVPTFF